MKTQHGIQKELIQKTVRLINWTLLIAGLLIGWAATRAVYELGYQVRGICGECGRVLSK